jgi:transcriptional regulator with XRE-family HTH domain
MSAVELASRAGITDSRVSQIERAEVEGSLRTSTLELVATALESRFVYVVLPDRSLEDLVLRQAYHQALTELSLPASVATDGTSLGPRTEDELEVRTLELVDRRGLWGTGRARGPSPW